MGLLRRDHPNYEEAYESLCTRDQLLGWWNIRADLLDHIIPLRRGETAYHDGSAGRCTERRTETIPSLERCGNRGGTGTRMARVLARVRAVFPQSVPGERNGPRGL